MSRRKTIEDCVLAAEKHGGRCLSKKYINCKSKLEWECSKGHRWFAIPLNVLFENSWCPFCSQNAKYSIELAKSLAEERGGKCLSNKYKNVDTHMKWECEEGHMKPTIIAEIGINFNDDMNVMHNMIRDCAIAGADYCKVQLYSPEALFGKNGEDPNEEIYNGVIGSELNKENVKQIMGWCREEGIGFTASVFDFERFGWCEELGIEVYKIASRTSKLTRDLAETIAKTGKPCWMSLGFDSEPLDSKYTNVQYLWCKSMYPTEYSEMKKMPKSFEDTIYAGISDHSLGIEASLVGVARGSKVVEKHVTYSKLGSAKSNFDHVCSITFDELAELVKYSKLMRKVVMTNYIFKRTDKEGDPNGFDIFGDTK